MKAISPSNLFDFRGKRVLVTGGGSGIGRGIALRFAQAGASVAVHYRNHKQGADTLVSAIKKLKHKSVAVAGDLTRSSDVERVVRETIKALGGLDVLINNAGSYPVSSLLEMSEEEWNSVVADNLTSVGGKIDLREAFRR